MGLGFWMRVWSLKQRYCWDTHTHTHTCLDTSPSPARLFLCLVLLTSFRDKNPPPLILFLTSHVCFLFFAYFDSHCYHGFYEATITTSTITFRSPKSKKKVEKERKKAWTGQVVGWVPQPGPHHYTWPSWKGRLFYVIVTWRSWNFAWFSRDIQRLQPGRGRERRTRERGREYVRSKWTVAAGS